MHGPGPFYKHTCDLADVVADHLYMMIMISMPVHKNILVFYWPDILNVTAIFGIFLTAKQSC